MDELAAGIGETVQIGVLERCNVLLVDRSVAHHEITVSGSRIGTRRHAHTCALGKTLLAHRYDDRALSCLLNDLSRYAIKLDLPGLTRELRDVRRTGLGYENGEAIRGIAGIAAPITDTSGRVIAAVGTITLSERFAARRPELERAVVGAASRISRRLAQADPPEDTSWPALALRQRS
jgi:DNA-binding IclR family transcriptional regulator